MSEGKLVSSIHKEGDYFKAYYFGDKPLAGVFATFDEATQWIIDVESMLTEPEEKAPDKLTEAEAVEINSNVNTPPQYPNSTVNE